MHGWLKVRVCQISCLTFWHKKKIAKLLASHSVSVRDTPLSGFDSTSSNSVLFLVYCRFVTVKISLSCPQRIALTCALIRFSELAVNYTGACTVRTSGENLRALPLNNSAAVSFSSRALREEVITLTDSLLTPRSRVLLEKLTCLELVKKFPAFYGTRRFITAFTSAYHLSLSWAS